VILGETDHGETRGKHRSLIDHPKLAANKLSRLVVIAIHRTAAYEGMTILKLFRNMSKTTAKIHWHYSVA